jgi:hypothetical protein
VPLHTSPVCAVAELRDVLSRTVAWLPAGMAAAPAHGTARANSTAITIDLLKLMARLQFEVQEQLRLALSSFGCSDDFNAAASCYTLSAGSRRNQCERGLSCFCF